MNSVNELSFSSKYLYIQVDAFGNIIDANPLFYERYGEIVSNSICDILHEEAIKEVIASTDSLKREKNSPIVLRLTTKQLKGSHISLWQIIYIKGFFIALGDEFQEEIVFALNHKIRSHSANIEGLAQFIESIEDVQIAKMLYTSAVALNAEIAALMKLLSNRS